MHGPFEPFQKVLVRDSRCGTWKCGLFSHFDDNIKHKYVCVGSCYEQCIKFEGNEHLLGTTDNPTPKHDYKWGDKVEVRPNDIWVKAIYNKTTNDDQHKHIVFGHSDIHGNLNVFVFTDKNIRPLAEDSNALQKS